MHDRHARRTAENATAAALTLLIAALLAAFLWWDHERNAKPVEAPRAQPAPELEARQPQPAPPKPRAPPQRSADALYRCDSATGTTYQTSECANSAKQTEVSRGTFSVVAPPRPPNLGPNRNAEPAGPHVGLISRTESEGDRNAAECKEHAEQIRRIDALARQRSSSQRMERLREWRRYHKDQMWVLKCGF